MVMVPFWGFSSPETTRSVVVLPQPEGPRQGHEVAVLNGEVDVPQDVVAAVKFINVLQFNAAHIIFPFCSVTIPGLTYSC